MFPAAQLLRFSDGATVLLPFSREPTGRGFPDHYISSPAGTFGGWLSADELTASHRDVLVKHIRTSMPDLTWRLSPYEPLLKGAATAVQFGTVVHDHTWALPLGHGLSAIVKRFSKGHKAAIKSAQKQGVTVFEAKELEQWEGYFDAYQDSLRRWGDRATSSYAWSLFDELFRLQSPRVRLWIAERDGELLAGALCLYARSHVVWWHGATYESAFRLQPANLLVFEALRDASDRGYKWFDFNPSGGHAGVETFKKHFGGTVMPSSVVTIESARQRGLRKAVHVKHAVKEALVAVPRRR